MSLFQVSNMNITKGLWCGQVLAATMRYMLVMAKAKATTKCLFGTTLY